jgi:hypothetical protein
MFSLLAFRIPGITASQIPELKALVARLQKDSRSGFNPFYGAQPVGGPA